MIACVTMTTQVRRILSAARQIAKNDEGVRVEGGLSDSPITVYLDEAVIYWAMKKNARQNLWICRYEPAHFEPLQIKDTYAEGGEE